MDPRTFLRIEGMIILGLALAGYFWVNGPLWLLVVLALAPDLFMLGYLAGPRIGSLSYNAAHTYSVPFALGAYGLWADARLALLVALIWAGHIGADRLVGYGLKHESSFTDTHLSTQASTIMQSTPTDVDPTSTEEGNLVA